MNFSINLFTAPNATVSAIGISTLWCPSDPTVAQSLIAPPPVFFNPGAYTMRMTSYGGNAGTWNVPSPQSPIAMGSSVPMLQSRWLRSLMERARRWLSANIPWQFSPQEA